MTVAPSLYMPDEEGGSKATRAASFGVTETVNMYIPGVGVAEGSAVGVGTPVEVGSGVPVGDGVCVGVTVLLGAGIGTMVGTGSGVAVWVPGPMSVDATGGLASPPQAKAAIANTASAGTKASRLR